MGICLRLLDIATTFTNYYAQFNCPSTSDDCMFDTERQLLHFRDEL